MKFSEPKCIFCGGFKVIRYGSVLSHSMCRNGSEDLELLQPCKTTATFVFYDHYSLIKTHGTNSPYTNHLIKQHIDFITKANTMCKVIVIVTE